MDDRMIAEIYCLQEGGTVYARVGWDDAVETCSQVIRSSVHWTRDEKSPRERNFRCDVSALWVKKYADRKVPPKGAERMFAFVTVDKVTGKIRTLEVMR